MIKFILNIISNCLDKPIKPKPFAAIYGSYCDEYGHSITTKTYAY